MDAESNYPGTVFWEESDNCWYYVIPITFRLDAGESQELSDVIIESISLNLNGEIAVPRDVGVYPQKYLSDRNIPSIKNRPVHIRAEGSSGQNTLCFKIPIRPQDRLPDADAYEGTIVIKLPFKQSFPIRLLADFKCLPKVESLEITDLKRADSPNFILVNLALVVGLLLILWFWNQYINSKTYRPYLDPKTFNDILLFTSGFFGLPILATVRRLFSFAALQSLLTYPELYLNLNLVKLLRAKFTMRTLIVLYIPILILVYSFWSYKLPKNILIWGYETTWADSEGNIINKPRVTKDMLKKSENQLFLVFSDLDLRNKNPNHFALGSAHIDRENNGLISIIPFSSLFCELAYDYREFDLLFSSSLNYFVEENSCPPQTPQGKNLKGFLKVAIKTNEPLSNNKCIELFKDIIINSMKGTSNIKTIDNIHIISARP